MNALFFFDVFMAYIPYTATAKNYEIIHADTKYCTLLHWDVVVLLSESPAIINDLDVIMHGFMLQIIYTTLHIRLFNRLTPRTVV
jgi:hypothetical protein